MANKYDADYAVGYRKPPAHAQFPKGRSGNPKGRRCGARSMTTLLDEALLESVSISENGARKKVSKLEVMVKQVVNKAASGDPRFIKLVWELSAVLGDRADTSAPQNDHFDDSDREVIRTFHERLKGSAQEGGDSSE